MNVKNPLNLNAEQATAMGYRRTSRRYGMCSRIDRPDWVQALARHYRRTPAEFYQPGASGPDSWACDYYRRVLSKDTIELNPQEALKVPASGNDPCGYIELKKEEPVPAKITIDYRALSNIASILLVRDSSLMSPHPDEDDIIVAHLALAIKGALARKDENIAIVVTYDEDGIHTANTDEAEQLPPGCEPVSEGLLRINRELQEQVTKAEQKVSDLVIERSALRVELHKIKATLKATDTREKNLRDRLDAVNAHASQLTHLVKGGSQPLDDHFAGR